MIFSCKKISILEEFNKSMQVSAAVCMKSWLEFLKLSDPTFLKIVFTWRDDVTRHV